MVSLSFVFPYPPEGKKKRQRHDLYHGIRYQVEGSTIQVLPQEDMQVVVVHIVCHPHFGKFWQDAMRVMWH